MLRIVGGNNLMKRLLCRFANWILRMYTRPEIAFNTDVYINGRKYKLIQATSNIYPYGNRNITFEVQEQEAIMAGFISKQPNGLYCRFSTVVDCPTDWNMTEEDYIELCKQKAEKEARDILANHLYPFEMVKERFINNNMTDEEFEQFLKDVEE